MKLPTLSGSAETKKARQAMSFRAFYNRVRCDRL